MNVIVVVKSVALHWDGHLFQVGSKHTYRILECKSHKGQECGRVFSHGENSISLMNFHNHPLEV